ncbi:hypothetical protein [Epilithonimonas zeae]|uniref:hypothetical protein n=1 Tax=Epilithonimonas zeae TaxID=1416779 RepID=UPI00200E1099|nr:hypothetical protein [Epilithonimonas zeae]UQB68643.1 hypothetical protein KI430_16790 [Epilithonimonas zeae]
MKSYILTLSFLLFNLVNGQEKQHLSIKKGDFPEGVYMTLEDVLNKKPTSTDEVYFKPADQKDSSDSPEKVFFYFKEKDKRVRIPLAVSYKGELYFQTYRKYTNKKDKGYDPDQYSRFCKVTNYGRFIYFEENMRGMWSKALLGNLSPMTYLMNGNIKGIVLDLDIREFNMLRDCVDLNDFLKQHQIPEIICDSDKFTIGELRTTIDEINKPYR